MDLRGPTSKGKDRRGRQGKEMDKGRASRGEEVDTAWLDLWQYHYSGRIRGGKRNASVLCLSVCLSVYPQQHSNAWV